MAKKKKPGILMIILAILLPFIAVAITKGLSRSLLITIILCILGYVPGSIYALWLILK